MNFEIKDFKLWRDPTTAVKASATLCLLEQEQEILSIAEVKIVERKNKSCCMIMPSRYAGKPYLRIEDLCLRKAIEKAMLHRYISSAEKLLNLS